jgi:hypothetical protein
MLMASAADVSRTFLMSRHNKFRNSKEMEPEGRYQSQCGRGVFGGLDITALCKGHGRRMGLSDSVCSCYNPVPSCAWRLREQPSSSQVWQCDRSS